MAAVVSTGRLCKSGPFPNEPTTNPAVTPPRGLSFSPVPQSRRASRRWEA